MAKNILQILFKTYNGVFILLAALLLILAMAGHILLGKQTSDTFIDQMFKREELAANAGVSSLETFFDLFGKSLVGLATRGDVISVSQSTKTSLNNFMSRWSGTPVAGVILVDKNGMVKLNENRDKSPDVGKSVADRDYFIWAKTAKKGSFFVSKPVISRLGASKDDYIVNVATPILGTDGSFRGVLDSAVILGEIDTQYLEFLKFTDKTVIYLVSENGDVLHSEPAEYEGKNFFDEMAKKPFLGSEVISGEVKKVLSSRQEGKLDVVYPLYPRTSILTRMLVVYTPVRVGDNYLVLAVATPADTALAFLTPYYFKGIAVPALALLAFLVLALRIAKITGYEEGVADGKKIQK